MSGKADEWDGHLWVWAKNQAGKEGWIPDTLVKNVTGKQYAKTAFSALELTCHVGDELLAINEKHGWVLCRAEDNSEGWVPVRNLNAI